jgi:hypothetical protein
MTTVLERGQITRNGGRTSRWGLAAPFRALRLVVCGTALVGLITSAAAGADPESDETITNEEFVRKVLEKGLVDIPLSELEARPQALPLLSREVIKGDRSELRAFLYVCSKLVAGEDLRAALIARAEILALLYSRDRELSDTAQEMVTPLMLSASEWVDEHSAEWAKAIRNVYGDRVLFDQHDIVRFEDLDFDPSKFAYLRIVNIPSPRSRDATKAIGNVGPQTLVFDRTRLLDADLKYLAGLSNVVLLELNETKITGSGLRDLDMPNLRFVHLYGCPVGDNTVGQIDIPTLELLDLQFTDITDMGLGAIRPGSISKLWIHGNKITAEGLSTLDRFQHLDSLSVDGKVLDETGLLHLKRCGKLRTIHVQGPLPEGMTREKLVAALPDCEFDIDDSTDSEESQGQ